MAFLDFIPIIGSAVSALGSIFGNKIGQDKAIQAVEKQNEGNFKLAQYSFDRNLDMWNLQNAYNTPSNQMARLEEAGLNPMLMYNQGNPGNASSSPQFEAPQMASYTGFGDMGYSRAGSFLAQGLQQYADFKLKDAQADQIRQNTVNLEQENELMKLRVVYQGLQNAKTQEEKEVWRNYYESLISNLDSRTDLNKSSIDLNSANIDFINRRSEGQELSNAKMEILLPYVEDEMKYKLQLMLSQNGVNRAKISKLFSDIEFQKVLIELSEQKIKLLDYEYDINSATWSSEVAKRQNDALYSKYKAEIEGFLSKYHINIRNSNLFNYLTGSGSMMIDKIVNE